VTVVTQGFAWVFYPVVHAPVCTNDITLQACGVTLLQYHVPIRAPYDANCLVKVWLYCEGPQGNTATDYCEDHKCSVTKVDTESDMFCNRNRNPNPSELPLQSLVVFLGSLFFRCLVVPIYMSDWVGFSCTFMLCYMLQLKNTKLMRKLQMSRAWIMQNEGVTTNNSSI